MDKSIGKERLASTQHAAPTSIRGPGFVWSPLPTTAMIIIGGSGGGGGGGDGVSQVRAICKPDARNKVEVETLGLVAMVDAQQPYRLAATLFLVDQIPHPSLLLGHHDEGTPAATGQSLGEPSRQSLAHPALR